MPHIDIPDLKELRDRAELTQKRLAERISAAHPDLAISQSLVSRTEEHPENASLKLINAWLEACGMVKSGDGLEPDPMGYIRLRQMIGTIEGYLGATRLSFDAQRLLEDRFGPPGELVPTLQAIARKPRIGLFGRFDSGKSRLANTLMGGDYLPAAYQPTTAIPCHVRHVEDRPEWVHENVWIMDEEFDLVRGGPREEHEQHRIEAGGYETLENYARHHDSPRSQRTAGSALVFVDVPLLRACEIIDLPGYGNSEEDSRRAEFGRSFVDILIYTSPLVGFLNQNDIVLLAALVQQLPRPAGDSSADPLRNLFIVATHAYASVDEASLAEALDRAGVRLGRTLPPLLAEHGVAAETLKAAVRRRLFTYSVEYPARRLAFEDDLARCLGADYAEAISAAVAAAVQKSRQRGIEQMEAEIGACEKLIKDRTRWADQLAAIRVWGPKRAERHEARLADIHKKIAQYRTETHEFILGELADRVDAAKIEARIKDLSQQETLSRKDTRDRAAEELAKDLIAALREFIRPRVEALRKSVDNFLLSYNVEGKTLNQQAGINFQFWSNPKQLFGAAVAGLGVAGALAGWAAIAAAGSNLGGYILVATIVGWLSSIGIGVGGGAAAVGAVAAIGGPITITVGLGALAAAAAYALLGPSWVSKLARQIEQHFKRKVLPELARRTDQFWDDTRKAFDAGADAVEQRFQAHLDELRHLLSTTTDQEIGAKIEALRECRDFFVGLPAWSGPHG